jgi:hypothetical protein
MPARPAQRQGAGSDRSHQNTGLLQMPAAPRFNPVLTLKNVQLEKLAFVPEA